MNTSQRVPEISIICTMATGVVDWILNWLTSMDPQNIIRNA